MNLDKIHSIYFIGIGGIGMSALARYFSVNGKKISGYDRTPSPLTEELANEGMQIHFEENVELIPKDVDLVVYTPAIPPDHKELVYYKEHHQHIIKRSDLLETLTKDLFTIAIAGTHGKTTTSSMIAHILKDSGYDCTAFLGGITVNYNSNFLIGKNKTVVVEADEYDRSFLKLHPNIAVVTSCDADHLDIYGNEEEVVKAYGDFANQIKSTGILITKQKLPFLAYYSGFNTQFYSVSGDTDFHASNVRLEESTYTFDFLTPEYSLADVHLSVAGYHNVENAVAAGAVAYQLEIGKEKIRAALNSFKGVKRRFEFIVRNEKVVFIDDYAHHPAEITAFLKSVREIFPGKQITCIFQPHLYTRTRDFADEFGRALSLADDLILLPVYPAREEPIPGVTSEMLLEKIAVQNKMVVEKKDLINELSRREREVVVTVGAGDIDQEVEPIKMFLTSKS
ncbi:MAG TPA: UDP-N-acetylmuramate--L-alanine ligase [Chitinophagales bacterium]|nr:UDP-N-acetylmuramate--L-alanine ligase [Chitinophagales bacterium]